jgi:threonine/homoserine/homoserine lactone efflux protein
MPSLHLLIPFALATLAFACVPGPAMLYTAGQTLAHGRRGGLLAAAGIHLGGYFHLLTATLGLAAVLRYVPTLYVAIKFAGAAYLFWLGVQMLRRSADSESLTPTAGERRVRTFFHSVAVEVLNPKVALFFLAFLPQFTDPVAALPGWAQFLVLGTIVNLTFSSADVLVTLFASAILRRLRDAGPAKRIAHLLGGSLLIGLGVKLAIARD